MHVSFDEMYDEMLRASSRRGRHAAAEVGAVRHGEAGADGAL